MISAVNYNTVAIMAGIAAIVMGIFVILVKKVK